MLGLTQASLPCEECGQLFKRTDDLARHRKSVHATGLYLDQFQNKPCIMLKQMRQNDKTSYILNNIRFVSSGSVSRDEAARSGSQLTPPNVTSGSDASQEVFFVLKRLAFPHSIKRAFESEAIRKA